MTVEPSLQPGLPPLPSPTHPPRPRPPCPNLTLSHLFAHTTVVRSALFAGPSLTILTVETIPPATEMAQQIRKDCPQLLNCVNLEITRFWRIF